MDIGVLLGTTSSAIGLAGKFAELVKQTERQGHECRLYDMILDLKKSAIILCRDFNDELQEINSEFFSSGIDVGKSLNQLHEELDWYSFLTKAKISSYEKKFRSIYERLCGFIDDAAAVAICSDNKEPLGCALRLATERSKELADILDPDVPLYEIFERMLIIVREIYEQLQGGQNQNPQDPIPVYA
ncbi:hypothetical protein [Methylomonas sp. AM2-LC]|uniref:hypothetical protein n=1 Tax=Methylomonas sp. AM2-LC TaxID=3153301 RepID=UPI003263C94B